MGKKLIISIIVAVSSVLGCIFTFGKKRKKKYAIREVQMPR